MVKLVFVVFLMAAVSKATDDVIASEEDCVAGPTFLYQGTHSKTVLGIECQKWTDQQPHQPGIVPLDGGNHNYCRNPDHDAQGLWCYTVDPNIPWAYCDVRRCKDDSRLIWAGRRNHSASILSVDASSGSINKQLTEASDFNVSVLVGLEHKNSRFVDVAGSYSEQTIFYADPSENCIFMKNLDMDMTSKHLHGLVRGAKAIAYDWIRQNLYWTDDIMKWITVVDATFSYYAPVYSTNQGQPRAMTLHALKQKLFFSVFQRRRSKLYVTDLAGENMIQLTRLPKLYDITSMAIDCTDDRLYIADNWRHGSMVFSTKLDGSGLRFHYFKRGGNIVGVSAYMDYIFMTDATQRWNQNLERVHTMWIKSKSSRKAFRFDFEGEPQGMKVLSEKEENSMSAGLENDDCLTMEPCEHICLPRLGEKRKCICALGYTKHGDTKCRLDTTLDSFLVIADQDQEKVFQIPLGGTSNNVSLLDLGFVEGVSKVVADPLDGSVYINGVFDIISKVGLDGKPHTSFSLPMEASSDRLAIDVTTGNVFFSDREGHGVYVTNNNAHVTKKIMTSNTSYASNIQRIALDIKNKKVYWTDTHSFEGHGDVMRMNMDGSQVETVIKSLQWPHALTVDYKRNSLFVSEAKKLEVFEIPLELNGNNAVITHLLKTPTTDIQGRINVTDIVTFNNSLYFLHNQRVMQKNFVTQEIVDYSHSFFYAPTSLAVYDHRTALYTSESFVNPCAQRACKSLCLPTSSQTSACV